MKRFKIIHIPNQYLLVVDESKSKEVGTFYEGYALAHLSLNNSPILKGVAVLPELVNNSITLGLNKQIQDLILKVDSKGDNGKMYNFFYKEGYKANPARFTEEDLRKAMDMYLERVQTNEGRTFDKCKDAVIQSLSQPKIPLFFEAEEETFTGTEFSEWSSPFPEPIEKIKTITNSKGQEEWVGKYIY